MSTIGRAPKDYNAGAWGRIVGRIDKAINTLAKRLGAGEDATRQLQITQREQRAALVSMLTPEATFEWSEYVDPSTNVVYAQCIVEVTRGWAIISDFEYRSAYGNIGSTDSWLSYKTNPAMQFVVSTNYKGGGYYLYREEIDFIKSGQTFSVELRGKASNDDVWLASSHTFDGNTKPEFLSEPKLVLQWYSSTETWQVRAIGEADDDTASIGFIVSDNVELDQQATTQYGDFVTGVTDLSGSDKRFNVLLGSFTPSTKASQRTLWVLAGAFDGASATTLDGTDNFVRVLSSIEIPVSPTAAGILEAGDIDGELLADTAKRASVNLAAQHTSGQESSSVTVSGTIQYDGDTTTYTISSQNINVGTSGALKYIYFDPSVSTNQLQVAVATGGETAKQVATKISGKRIFVGIASGDTVERAFFVFTSDAPVISAPYVYASKLEALTARMGTLIAGSANFKIGDSVSGTAPNENDGIFIDNYNYWYDSGDFSVGNSSNAITYNSTTGTLNVGVAAGVATYKQAPPAPSPVNAGDLWYNETDDNIQRYNGTGWDIIGSDVEYWRSVSDTTKITGSVVRTGVIQSNNWPSSGTQIDLDNDTIKSGGSASPAFSVTSFGVMSCTGATVSGAITATSGSITGAFSVAAELSIGTSGSLTIGGSTFATAGIQADYTSGTPRFYAGDGNNKHIKWDGSALSINIDGNITVDDNGIRILSQSGNVDKIRWVNGGGSSIAEIYTGGGPAFTITASGLSIALLGSNVKINKGVALFADISTPSTEAAGQSFFTTMYSLGGDFYKRGGTSTAYKILDASDFPITANNGDTLYYNSGWQKLAKGSDGQVLTLASGLPTWAASGGGGSYQPLDSDLTAIAALTPTTGQIIFAQSGSWTSLPIGTAGTFLKSSFGTPSWTSITASDIASGTFADAQIAESSVTQHEAALSITESQISDFGTYLDASSGQTITFNDTEFQAVDGGTQTEYRQRTITVTNGQITSVGTFGSWVAVAVN